MIPNFETPPKEKLTDNIIVGILGLTLIVSSICFTAIGVFNLGKALFTEYNLTTLDMLYFTSGIMILFMIAIVNLLSDIKKQNVTIAKGVLHLLKQKVNNNSSKPTAPFGDMLKNLFSRQPGMSDDDVSGSISLYDVSNPDNPIFQGDFKNSDEMDEIKRNLMNKMLNSHKEFKGKKMTKQEMLDSLNLRELKAELKLAIETEDWLWAASIRDKIAEKDTKKKGNSDDIEKKDSTDL
jgi:hypothetical protein